MRIVHVVDAAQAQATVQQRFSPPPTDSPPRRVQAINRQASPDDSSGVGTSPPDDGISLALSPESREAARMAAIDQLRASRERDTEPSAAQPSEPEEDVASERSRQEARVQELERTDREVRARGHAHAAAVGSLAGTPTFTYQVGPDGRLYAVSGEVKIDTSPVAGDPAATLRKAQQIERAAFAPGDPSPEDRRAAAMASALATRARQELARQEAQKDAPIPAQHTNRRG
jgi:hypothetical protein